MKHRWMTFVLTLVVLLAIPANALAAGPRDGRVVLGDTFTLTSGKVLDGDLVIIGGVVTLEQGSRVAGDVVLFGGTLSADGLIEGNLATLGGTVSLGRNAVVRGDLLRFGAVVHKEPGATVLGQEVTGRGFELPSIDLRGAFTPFRTWNFPFFPLGDAVSVLLQSLVLGALAVLVMMFLPDHVARVSRAIVEQPVISGGLGLLTLIVVPAILVILIITVCLIPVSAVAFVALGVAVVFGIIGGGLEVGLRLAKVLKQDFHPAASAGLGTLLVVLVAGAMGKIPCVGWIAPLLVASLAVGSVILTRFGTRFYTPVSSQPPSPLPPAA